VADGKVGAVDLTEFASLAVFRGARLDYGMPLLVEPVGHDEHTAGTMMHTDAAAFTHVFFNVYCHSDLTKRSGRCQVSKSDIKEQSRYLW
jgi:hypothetical protein